MKGSIEDNLTSLYIASKLIDTVPYLLKLFAHKLEDAVGLCLIACSAVTCMLCVEA